MDLSPIVCGPFSASLDLLFSNSVESLELLWPSWLLEVSNYHRVDPVFQIRAVGQHMSSSPAIQVAVRDPVGHIRVKAMHNHFDEVGNLWHKG